MANVYFATKLVVDDEEVYLNGHTMIKLTLKTGETLIGLPESGDESSLMLLRNTRQYIDEENFQEHYEVIEFEDIISMEVLD